MNEKPIMLNNILDLKKVININYANLYLVTFKPPITRTMMNVHFEQVEKLQAGRIIVAKQSDGKYRILNTKIEIEERFFASKEDFVINVPGTVVETSYKTSQLEPNEKVLQPKYKQEYEIEQVKEEKTNGKEHKK